MKMTDYYRIYTQLLEGVGIENLKNLEYRQQVNLLRIVIDGDAQIAFAFAEELNEIVYRSATDRSSDLAKHHMELAQNLRPAYDELSRLVHGVPWFIVQVSKLWINKETAALHYAYVLQSGDYVNPFSNEAKLWEVLATINGSSSDYMRKQITRFYYPAVRRNHGKYDNYHLIKQVMEQLYNQNLHKANDLAFSDLDAIAETFPTCGLLSTPNRAQPLQP